MSLCKSYSTQNLTVLKDTILNILTPSTSLALEKLCQLKCNFFLLLEPLPLIAEGEYNLDALTEITITDDFLGLSMEDKECDMEPYHDCTTRHYRDTVLEECGCLPLNIRQSEQVQYKIFTILI